MASSMLHSAGRALRQQPLQLSKVEMTQQGRLLRTVLASRAIQSKRTSIGSSAQASCQYGTIVRAAPDLSLVRPRALAVAIWDPVRGMRFYASNKIDRKAEMEIANRKLKPHPEEVSLGSSTSHVRDVHDQNAKPELKGDSADADMLGGIRADLATVKETFSLQEVPKEVVNIGLLGVLPYLGTSISTAYLSWDINYASHHGGLGFMFSQDTAQTLLTHLQPIQIGYGAVIISFLGAIHWGLEFAGFNGHKRYNRYAIGIAATLIAWPTLLLPQAEHALIAQFLGFNAMYLIDSQAAKRGWAPHWYPTYRFMLTFIVGASIVISLIARGEVTEEKGLILGNPTDRLQKLKDADWDQLEEEEKTRLKKVNAGGSAGGEVTEGDDEEEAEEATSDDSDAEAGDADDESSDNEEQKSSGDDKQSKGKSKPKPNMAQKDNSNVGQGPQRNRDKSEDDVKDKGGNSRDMSSGGEEKGPNPKVADQEKKDLPVGKNYDPPR